MDSDMQDMRFNEDDIEIEDWKPDLQNIQDTKQKQQQKCHICDKFFENLELHFASTHEG